LKGVGYSSKLESQGLLYSWEMEIAVSSGGFIAYEITEDEEIHR
jgi:hypothetical protein